MFCIVMQESLSWHWYVCVKRWTAVRIQTYRRSSFFLHLNQKIVIISFWVSEAFHGIYEGCATFSMRQNRKTDVRLEETWLFTHKFFLFSEFIHYHNSGMRRVMRSVCCFSNRFPIMAVRRAERVKTPKERTKSWHRLTEVCVCVCLFYPFLIKVISVLCSLFSLLILHPRLYRY